MRTKKTSLACFLTILCFSSLSQDFDTVVVRDFQLWKSFAIEKQLGKKIKLQIEPNFRLVKNWTKPDQFFINSGIDYKPSKKVKLGFYYRFISDYEKEETQYFHRINVYGSYQEKINRLSISYRLMFQVRNDEYNLYSYGDPILGTLRNRLAVDYNLKKSKFSPEFSTEFFTEYKYNSSDFSRLRFSIGSNYKINKANNLSVSYKLENNFRKKKTDQLTNVFSVSYTHTIDKKEKKKKE